jgi:hypothetical protein
VDLEEVLCHQTFVIFSLLPSTLFIPVLHAIESHRQTVWSTIERNRGLEVMELLMNAETRINLEKPDVMCL